MNIFEIIFPIFAIISTGFFLRQRKVVNDEWVHILNTFTYYVALPAVIIASFWKVSWLEKSTASLLGFNTLVLLGMAALIMLVLSTLSITRKTKAAIFLTTLVGNTIYMGFPLVGNALGKDNFSLVVAAGTAHLTLGIAFSILATEFYVLKTKKISRYIYEFITNPLVIAMAAGFVFSFIHTPLITGTILKYTEMLGATASPVALFALGGFLHGKFMHHHIKLAMVPVAIKLLIFPVIIYLAALAFGLHPIYSKASILIAAMPTAVTAFVVSEKYKLDESFVANCILLTTAISLVSISLWLLVLN